jgi:23S rRNA (pseudouridine1915-N3)-methyltransferase
VKFLIVAVGHRMPGWVEAGFDEYARRIPRDTPIVLKAVRPEPRSGSGPAAAGQIERALRAEGQRLSAAITPGSRIVALDERGQQFSTESFARSLAAWLGEGRDVAFLIGGADGLDPALKRSAHVMLSVSAMTLPHQLVRVVLAEQLYRALSLLHNHPYHRA